MKLIVVVIREIKLDELREALIDNKITRITIYRVSGHGQQKREEIYRGKRVIPNLTPKVKIEIVVNDEFVDITVDTILKHAKTDEVGELGDGKIWICPVEECIRIRTGEKGSQAV